MSEIPNLPLNMPQEQRKFLQKVKYVLEQLPESFSSPPGNSSVPRVNPLPGGNKITFTGGNGATQHFLYISPTPTWNPLDADNHVVDLGLSTTYTDIVGQAGVNRYYWIQAVRGSKKAQTQGPVLGQTLGLGTPAANTPGTGNQPGNITVDTTTGLPSINIPRLNITVR